MNSEDCRRCRYYCQWVEKEWCLWMILAKGKPEKKKIQNIEKCPKNKQEL